MEGYFDLMSFGVLAYLALRFDLLLKVDPELAGGSDGVFRVVVNPAVIFLVDDGVRPSGAFWMKLHIRYLTHMVSVLLKMTLLRMPLKLGQKWHRMVSIYFSFFFSAKSQIILHR